MLSKLVAGIIKWRLLVIVLTILVTVFMVSQMRHLKVIIDPNQMLPQQHPYVIGTEGVQRYLTVVDECAQAGLARAQ